MKALLFISIIGFCTTNSFSQSNCNIENEYRRMFKIKKQKYKDKKYLQKTISDLDSSSCFSSLVNNNKKYINYLRTNFYDNSSEIELVKITNPEELHTAYIKSLKNDMTFTRAMEKLTMKIYNKAQYVPDTVTIDDLLNIAIKSFALIGITKEGNYKGKLCSAVSGFKQTEKERKPQMEAFCFVAIFESRQTESFNMHKEFIKGIKKLQNMTLGIDDQDNLLRAQGAMYMYMKSNEKLQKLLLQEYSIKKEYLPFILKTN